MALTPVGDEAATVMVSGPSVPQKKVTDIGADYFAWAHNAKTVAWAVGASYFRQPFNSISFEPPKDEKKDGEKKDGDAKDADKDKDKKDSTDAKKEDKKDEKKDEKKPQKFKRQEKEVQKIPIAIELPR